jgi:hypothetical protein
MTSRAAAARLVALVVAAAVAGSGAVLAVPMPATPAAHAAPAPLSSPSRYVPVGPERLADTRDAACGCTRIDAATIRVQVTGRVGIPAGAEAAAITVTATGSAAATFVTVWPSGTARPETSTVNVAPGQTVANAAIVPLSDGGAIDLFSPAGVDLVVDVSGVFVAATTARDGRFIPAAPVRLLDTRETGSLAAGAGVVVARPAQVPADAVALAVNVTSVGATRAGFVTAYAAGTPVPSSSVLNPDGTGAAIAASVIVPMSPAGIALFNSGPTDLLVDLVGWFTGPGAADGSDGLFVAVAPTRLLDTRAGAPRLWANGTRELAVDLPGAAAVVTNVTLDRTDAAGFVTAYPAGAGRPATSSLNARSRNAVVANAAITGLADRGLAWYSNAGTDLVVDMTGWFVGSPVASVTPVPPNVPVAPRVLLIGDSTLAALNVVTASQRALQGMVPVLDAAPCRRLVRPSCRSAFTGEVPDTAVQAIARTPGAIDVVVVKAGYNEGTAGFQQAVEDVLSAARTRGTRVVVWLTYSEGTGNQLRTYTANNAVLTTLRDSGAWPELVIADWRTYAANSSGWYSGDRVHLQGGGAWATADYVTRWVASALHRPCPQPWIPGGAIDDRCPSPDVTASQRGAPDLRGLYGF